MSHNVSIASACMHHVSRIHRLMQFYDKCNSGFDDLTFLQMQLLLFVMEHKHSSMKDLAEHFKVKPASVTPLIDRLVARDMLVRTQDEVDRRVTNVSLTSKAEQSLMCVFEEKTKVMDFMLNFLEEKDQQSLLRIMKTIDEGLSDHFASA